MVAFGLGLRLMLRGVDRGRGSAGGLSIWRRLSLEPFVLADAGAREIEDSLLVCRILFKAHRNVRFAFCLPLRQLLAAIVVVATCCRASVFVFSGRSKA